MTQAEVRRYFEMTQEEAEQTRKELRREVSRCTKPCGKKNKDGIYYQALRIVADNKLQNFINIRMCDTLKEALEMKGVLRDEKQGLARLQKLYEDWYKNNK